MYILNTICRFCRLSLNIRIYKYNFIFFFLLLIIWFVGKIFQPFFRRFVCFLFIFVNPSPYNISIVFNCLTCWLLCLLVVSIFNLKKFSNYFTCLEQKSLSWNFFFSVYYNSYFYPYSDTNDFWKFTNLLQHLMKYG